MFGNDYEIQLKSKLDFVFVNFPYKLICLDFFLLFFLWINEHIFYTISIQIFCMCKY